MAELNTQQTLAMRRENNTVAIDKINKILASEDDLFWENFHLFTQIIGPLPVPTDRELLMWRSGLSILNLHADVCLHHEYKILKRFSLSQKKCYDPFKVHTKDIKGSLREVNLPFAKEMCKLGFPVIPGFKVCPSCRMEISKRQECVPDGDDDQMEDDQNIDDIEQNLSINSVKDSINSSLIGLELSPLKLHAVPTHIKISHGKRKLNQVNDVFSKKVATVLKVDADELSVNAKNQEESVSNEARNKANDLDFIVNLMKEKLKTANRQRKLQILTLTPNSWSLRRAALEFKVSKSTIQKAKILRNEKGLIELPNLVTGKRLKQEVVDLVKSFYCDDEYSRQLPGKNDCVSIGNKQLVSKRLILSNLNELYAAFKTKHPEIKIGFSKFASLRPKWCISVGPKGTHCVCVCTIHQNLKLMLAGVSLDKDYHELINLIVCDRDSKICMIHRCESCPGINAAEAYLREQLVGVENGDCEEDSDNEEETIKFKQWTTTDRADLITQTVTAEEFITILLKKLNQITSHSYIARSQANYLKTLKENLINEEVIVLGDFAENYKFLIQDEIQGYHWNKQQCTLHPVVIYYRHNETLELSHRSLCFISNDLDHDVNMVYKVMSDSVSYIKENISNDIKLVHYFSDGCAGQYKNCKHFLNLCFHQQDFSVDCQWNFFATSHGKSPCDGIGGTVKRLAAKASLQRPVTEQILTAEAMFWFCSENIRGIDFSFFSADEMSTIRENLKIRFINSKTLPGTRSFHQFIPLSSDSIATKRVSEEEEYTLTFYFNKDVSKSNIQVKPAQFLVCLYDNVYWVGMACEIDDDNADINVKFMHPHYPSGSFKWPAKDDTCWIPAPHIICVIDTPSLSTVSGRQYNLSLKDVDRIDEIISSH